MVAGGWCRRPHRARHVVPDPHTGPDVYIAAAWPHMRATPPTHAHTCSAVQPCPSSVSVSAPRESSSSSAGTWLSRAARCRGATPAADVCEGNDAARGESPRLSVRAAVGREASVPPIPVLRPTERALGAPTHAPLCTSNARSLSSAGAASSAAATPATSPATTAPHSRCTAFCCADFLSHSACSAGQAE